ncbi:MAG: tetratricopeptide repeat protein [wastewater metagenome]|nr:tetratricopeptide repeat protein [Candidatus Loosdrechtia aerotolerans]
MNSKTIISLALVTFITGCNSTARLLRGISPFKSEEAVLESHNNAESSTIQKTDDVFVCAGDIDIAYKKLGMVSLGEFGFSGQDILIFKIKEEARTVGAQAVINVQYDTGASKSWQGYGELGGTDYGVRHTSWCKGMAVVFLESYNHLGLLACNLTKENREWFQIKKKQNGVLVANILPGSTAANAGIKVEDLITEWNSEKVESRKHLTQLIQASAGKEAKLAVIRNREIKVMTLSVPVSPPDVLASTTSNSFREEKHLSTKLSTEAADVYNEVGDLYLRKGMYNEAIREYRKAIEADPSYALPHFNLSIVYEKKGMKEEADREFATYRRLKQKRK